MSHLYYDSVNGKEVMKAFSASRCGCMDMVLSLFFRVSNGRDYDYFCEKIDVDSDCWSKCFVVKPKGTPDMETLHILATIMYGMERIGATPIRNSSLTITYDWESFSNIP